MVQPMKCIGDADTLMKLKMYRVTKEWLDTKIPNSEKVLGLLDKRQI